ncbi:hypothetical protein [Psychrobacter alimentarius]|uniref:hypothetical protein n=1 Tax=Psychrobacter alimentarius TaxID=261164 RepID=UPI0019199C61|nr:hypothetical protein [Psychrobacter alimentarius]
MITLSTFQEYLSSKKSLSQAQPPSMSRSANGQEHYLLKLLATLPSQTPEQQAEQLEKILTVLREVNIKEQQRLKLLAQVIDASEQLIATLRQHYIYETGALNDVQLSHMAQVKSLYYLIIMAYDRVIHYKQTLLQSQKKPPSSKVWKRYFKVSNDSSVLLATAIYQTLLMYQKLLSEEVICYQKPSPYLWYKINRLYALAHQRHVLTVNHMETTSSLRASNIHQLYCQICLHSLLNLRAMQRQTVLLVQRLLPEWSKYIVATIEPKTETRVFVDLDSDKPPAYLTANSDINPYEDHHHCLFIELGPLLAYFEARVQSLIVEDSEGAECYLLNKLSMTMRYRYLQTPLTPATKHAIKQEAVLITGFNNIHYRVSGSQSFANLIAVNDLPEEQRPRYETGKHKRGGDETVIHEILSNSDTALFRRLQLVSPSDHSQATNTETILNKDIISNDSEAVMDSNIALTKALLNQEGSDLGVVHQKLTTTAPLLLSTLSLFLICRPDISASADWSIGVARWLHLEDKNPEVEWQVLGHAVVACGVRLEGRDNRSQHFVPAFILGGDEQLQTAATLIVPTAYFQSNDRVTMRINNKQTPLRLEKRVLFTDEFSQYEIVKI